MELIFSVSTRFLEMMAEVTLAWLLLESAVVADKALQQPTSAQDKPFYQGKITSALFFINNTLPGVFSKAEIIALADESAANASTEMFIGHI